MNWFRYIVGGLFGLLAISWLFSFGLGIAFGSDVWLFRAKRLRHYIWLVGLFWFNVEIWGRVVYTLLHWKG